MIRGFELPDPNVTAEVSAAARRAGVSLERPFGQGKKG
jgi:hypothetical protein